MLYLAFIFFIVSIVAAVFGMNGIAGLTMDIAQFIIGAFVVLAITFLALGVWGYKKAKNALKRN